MSFETFFASDKFNLFQTIIPYVGSKNGLFIYRVLVMIVLIFGYYCSIYTTAVNHNPERDWMWFSYFTNQNYVAITIYFLVFFFFFFFFNFFYIFYFFIILLLRIKRINTKIK